MFMSRLRDWPALSVIVALTLGTSAHGAVTPQQNATPPATLALLNRLSWGVSPYLARTLPAGGIDGWLEGQLRGGPDMRLPPAAQVQIDRMSIVREPVAGLMKKLRAQRMAAFAIKDPIAKKAAIASAGKAMEALATEAATRSILRNLYSPAQLRERMTWFWFNHFNVKAGKRDIRAMIGDYEDRAIRSHALGRYRDLLEATLRHPAMLRYLENDRNAAGQVNENYARELMELHSMGVGSGYTQKDVQELARILSGVGVNPDEGAPRLKPQWRPLYQRSGLFEFNPARHDFGDKIFLGQRIKGAGFAEVEQALDLLAHSPATARHVSRQMARYFLGSDPSAALLDAMAATFRRSDGDIPAVLRTLFQSTEFRASLGKAFKDPMQYVISAVRLAHDDRVILNTAPVRAWLNRMGQGLYGQATPDGYPLTPTAWSAPSQMIVRFEIARQIGNGSAGLFDNRASGGQAERAAPLLQANMSRSGLAGTLGLRTRGVLHQAASGQEWNILFLSSPEFMQH